MSGFFTFLGAAMWVIGVLGIIVFSILAFIYRKRKSFSVLLGAGTISLVIIVIGIALMTFAEESYWERQEMSKSEEKENEEIVRNIQENYENEEKAFQNSIKEQEKAIETSQETMESEEVVETSNQNNLEIDPLEEQGVYNAVVNYGNYMMEAINTGDFSIVEPYLLPKSKLYISQEKLVDDLHNKGIVEHFYTFNIESVSRVDINLYEAETFEEIGIESRGKEEIKEFRWIYTIENVNGQYLLSDIKTNKQ